MRRTIIAIPLLFLVGVLSLTSENIGGQEREVIPERILNPLPDFDPFDRPPSTPQFFPDEVDKRAREALIDSLMNKEEPLEGHVRFLMKKDAELKKERGTMTGLTEQVLDLHHNTIGDRERYLEAQRKALSSSTSTQQKQRIESRLRNDELTQAEELMRKSAQNRWGGTLNRLLGSVDVTSLVTRSYIGSAVDATVAQILAAVTVDMPIEERRALAFYLEHLKRHPDDPKNEAVRKEADALDRKKKSVWVKKQVDKAAEATEKGEVERALFYYEVASVIDPDSTEVANSLEQLRKRLQQRDEERARGLLAVAEPQGATVTTREREIREFLYALTLRDQEGIEAQAKTLGQKYKGQPLAESARDASAVALEIKGKHEEAKKILQQIASSSSNPHEKRRAEALLKSPEYNLLASFQDARRQHRLETVKYVILGEDFLKRNLLAAGPLIASGPAGATSLAAANVVMMGAHLIQVFTANPISNQAVIDKGVNYIRQHPQSQSATEVYRILADAYEDIGMYDKAIAFHQMSGNASEKKIADLKEKAGNTLLRAAERSTEKSAKEAYLKIILEDFPETNAAKEAVKKLSTLAKIENQGLKMSKKFLIANPELYGPQGLGLKPTLFDGKPTNMELADRGVNLLSANQLLLHFQTPWGVQTQVYPMNNEASNRFQIALRKKNYDLAIEDLHLRAKGSPGGIKNLPLPIVRGELDRKGSESEDTTFTLIREATGPAPDYPRVLDYELITEAERDGTIFKLPPMQGSISASGVRMSGSLPAGLWGNKITLGTDEKSPFAGLQLPIPLLQGFIPVDFLVQGRPGRFSIFPKIHLHRDRGDDQELFR